MQGKWEEMGQMAPVGLYWEGTGATEGFQAAERQKTVLLGKRRVWGPSSSGAWGYETHRAEEHGLA